MRSFSDVLRKYQKGVVRGYTEIPPDEAMKIFDQDVVASVVGDLNLQIGWEYDERGNLERVCVYKMFSTTN